MTAPAIYPTVHRHPRPVRAVGYCSYGHEAEELWDGVCAEHLYEEGLTRPTRRLRTVGRYLLGACWVLGYLISLLIGGVFCTSPFWLTAVYLHTQGVW
jgi:hypothetical protein